MRDEEAIGALRFHEGTNYPGGEFLGEWPDLDSATRPSPYKIYPTLDSIPMDVSFPASSTAALAVIAGLAIQDAVGGPDLDTLARVLFFSNGVTKHIRSGGHDVPFRAAPCTGALYHVELYVVCGDLPGLAAGVYHYGAHDNGLRQLRPGDFRQVLHDATANEPGVVGAPAIVVATSTFWRNAWKYGARAYRHTFWDTGTMFPNTLATAQASGLHASVVLGFVDAAVNRLLDVDGEQEFTVALVPLGRDASTPAVAPTVEPLELPFEEAPRSELDEPAIRAVHAASSLGTIEDVVGWRGGVLQREPGPVERPLIPLQPLDTAERSPEPVETVIWRRGSTRRFTHDAITWPQLSTILSISASNSATDIPFDSLGEVYLIVNAVEGVDAGTYVHHPDRDSIEALASGDGRAAAQHLALGQDLGGDAAVNIYVMSDLAKIFAAYGDRGYRAAQLAAAMFGGKVYLASYALGIGATGLTFWDSGVTEYFAPHAASKRPMFLVAVGHKASEKG